jgi:hypothetical protein
MIMDTATILAITSISGIGITILSKVLYELRHNVKNFCGIAFRTPISQSRASPQHTETELNNFRKQFEANKIVPQTRQTEDDKILSLEQQIRLKELEERLKRYEKITENDILQAHEVADALARDPERVYI